MLFPFDAFVKYAPCHCIVCMCLPISFCHVCTYPYTCICAYLCPFVMHVLTHMLLCMCPCVSFCCVCVRPCTCVCAHVYPSVVYVSVHILVYVPTCILLLGMCLSIFWCFVYFVSLDFDLFLDLPTHLSVLIVALLLSNPVLTIVLILYVACFLMFLHLS